MTRALLALVAAAAPGCGFGFGSAYVGEWRARDRVDAEVCVEDDQGRCAEQRQLVSRVPARRYWGVAMSMPMGVAVTDADGETSTRLRLGMSGEYLRGYGRFALGLRGDFLADYDSTFVFSTPITAVGHVGLSERFSLFGGAGVSPLNSLQPPTPEGETTPPPAIDGGLGLRVLAGLRTVLTHTHQATRIILTFEADAMRTSFDGAPYRSFGLVGHIGIFL